MNPKTPERDACGTISPDKTISGPSANGHLGHRLPRFNITKNIDPDIGYSFSGPLTVSIRTPLQDGSTCQIIDVIHLMPGSMITLQYPRSTEWSNKHKMELFSRKTDEPQHLT